MNVYYNKSIRMNTKYSTFKNDGCHLPQRPEAAFRSTVSSNLQQQVSASPKGHKVHQKEMRRPLEKAIKDSLCVGFQRQTAVTEQDLSDSLDHNHVAPKCVQSKHIFAPKR